MYQEQLIDQITRSLPANLNLTSLFLAGSFGRGDPDQFSDIDLVAIIDPAHLQKTSLNWRSYLDAVLDIVFWQERTLGNTGFIMNAITQDWARIDFVGTTEAAFQTRTHDGLKPLYDPNNFLNKLAQTAPPKQPDIARIRTAINEFIRVLGLLTVGVGRREYVTLVAGTGLLRDQLTTLMIEASPVHHEGGALHLSKIISTQDMATLAALPYPAPKRAPAINASVEIARVFFPYARALAKELDIIWPQQFEQATQRLLVRNFGDEFNVNW